MSGEKKEKKVDGSEGASEKLAPEASGSPSQNTSIGNDDNAVNLLCEESPSSLLQYSSDHECHTDPLDVFSPSTEVIASDTDTVEDDDDADASYRSTRRSLKFSDDDNSSFEDEASASSPARSGVPSEEGKNMPSAAEIEEFFADMERQAAAERRAKERKGNDKVLVLSESGQEKDMDDTEKNSENLPLEEAAGDDEGDNAGKSPLSPLSQHSSTQNLVVEDGYLPNTSHSLPPNSFEEFKRKFIKELFGDDDDDDFENLPPEEPLSHDGGDNAEKSPSPPLSQCSTTQNLVIKDNGVPKTHRQSLSPESYQEPKFKFLKKQLFGDDCDTAKMETFSDEQDSVTVSVQEAPPPRNDSKALHELKLKYLRDLFGDDYSDTTEDDDLRSTAKTSKRALTSFHGSNIIRETRPSSSAAKNLAD